MADDKKVDDPKAGVKAKAKVVRYGTKVEDK